MPMGQISMYRVENPEDFVGQRLTAVVTEANRDRRNLVLSHRGVMERERNEQREKLLAELSPGQIREGIVRSLRDFGAFVDLGGVEGLIHISELGYGRVEHPSQVLQEGQTVEVQVVKVEGAEGSPRRQVGLSLKALAQDPRTTAPEKFPPGTTVPGIVRRLEQFGAFVEIAPGLDGLVHISKIVLDRRIAHPRNVLNVGDQVEVTVVSVDPEKRRISLSMIEKARDAKEAAQSRERAEEKAAIAEQNAPAKLGTLGDLLSKFKR
jgi:small subunit ribosomal protein S1